MVKTDDICIHKVIWSRLFIHQGDGRSRPVQHGGPINQFTNISDIAFPTRFDILIVDPHAGTASTLVASIPLSRRSIGIEVNESIKNLGHERIDENWETLSGLSHAEGDNEWSRNFVPTPVRLTAVYSSNLPTTSAAVSSRSGVPVRLRRLSRRTTERPSCCS